MLIIKLGIMTVLLLVAIQDFKYRAVYWIAFPVLSILLFLDRSFKQETMTILQNTLFNLSFVLLQLLIVTVWFSLKNKKWINLIKGFLGLGDILFLIGIACYLSFASFIVFYIASLLFVLIIWLIWSNLKKASSNQVPLAGLQAILFLAVIVSSWWIYPVTLTDNDWALTIITL